MVLPLLRECVDYIFVPLDIFLCDSAGWLCAEEFERISDILDYFARLGRI